MNRRIGASRLICNLERIQRYLCKISSTIKNCKRDGSSTSHICQSLGHIFQSNPRKKGQMLCWAMIRRLGELISHAEHKMDRGVEQKQTN